MSDASIGYTTVLSVVALAAAVAAYRLEDLTLGTAAAVVAVYALHLIRVRLLRRGCRKARATERLAGELGGTPAAEPIVSRRFGPGAVALIEGVMDPSEVVAAMVAAGTSGGPRFGKIAREKGYVTEDEWRELKEARKEGRFLRDEVRLAQRRLEEFARG